MVREMIFGVWRSTARRRTRQLASRVASCVIKGAVSFSMRRPSHHAINSKTMAMQMT
jgi:hypothetical protein